MNPGMFISFGAFLIPLILVPSIIALSARHKRREWQHKERLRAMELGLPAHAHESRIGGGTVTAIGAGVPAVSTFMAFLTSVNIPRNSDEYIPILAVVWGCAFLISLGASISSLVLGIMLVRASRSNATAEDFAAKPTFEPDAYDVVSMRG